ncbi:MAG: hypothetical protein CVU36_06120 [Betaproteobacteria bacterium HGW-Betaproteobacteria-9]|jgi:hypothetical protein|nr:MAG: hypothetical protein CVU36_06120 [Betaproteobacteria bacterium HGW-Betaproteobacteria-9]
MISFTTSQPVHWPPAASPVVAPVTTVSAVQPTQALSRDTQTGTNTGGRDGQAQASRMASGGKGAAETTAPSTSKAAPLLPREHTEGGRENAPTSQTDAAEKAERQEAEAQAQEKAAQKPQLQEVLSSVWKASAAVVDVVLGREQQIQAAAAADGAAGVAPAGAIAAVSAASSDTNTTPLTSAAVPAAGKAAPALPGEDRSGQEPVAYTVQGTSSWPPLEAGSLISRRV